MEKMKFHHIGIAVSNMEEMLEHLKAHMEVSYISEPVFDENQNGTLCMAALADGTNIELVSGGVVKGIVKKRRFLYHSCFCVQDIEKKAAELLGDGYLMVSEPKAAALFQNRRVCFLSGELGMIELLEETSGKQC